MRPLRWGMIGGGEGAFIGAVHRMAARLDGRYQLVAGVFSSDAEKTQALGDRARRGCGARLSDRRGHGRGRSEAARWRRSGLGRHAESRALRAVGGAARGRARRDLRQAAHHQSRRRREAREARGRKEAVVRRHVQLHRLPDDPPRQAAHRRRADRHAARGAGRISAGLAGHGAREDRAEAGELAHRSQAGRRGRARRHRLAFLPARRVRHRREGQRGRRRRDAPSFRAGPSTTTSTCCCVSPMARAAVCGRARWPSDI